MLNPSLLKIFETAPAGAPMHQRLPGIYETPALTVDVLTRWVGTRKGAVVEVTDHLGEVTVLPVPEDAQFVFAADLNLHLAWGFVLGGVITWNFYNAQSGDWDVISFPADNAVAALDTDRQRTEPPIDISLVYQLGEDLYVRYQRDRYTLPRYLGKAPPRGVLRTMGMTADNRWAFRFSERLPDDFTLEVPDGS